MSWEVIGIWVAGLLTLAIYSFLYRDNPVYKIAEHLYVGLSTGYLVVIAIQDALWKDLYVPLFESPQPEYIVIFPGFLGFLVFTHFSKKYSYLSRLSIAFIIGATAGISIPAYIQGYLLKHTSATMIPLLDDSVSMGTHLNNLLILIGVVTVLIYFFFSIKHEGVMKPVSRVGTFYLMLFFGAAFGYTVMGRVSLLIGRMRFLLIDWIGMG